ncbi:MAG: FHA domain-containing protein [Granulosicoccus sp.]
MTKQLSRHHPSLYISGGTACGNEQFWHLTQTMIIGRQEADITISIPSLSRRHAEVSVVNGMMCKIQDLNSKNGTAVNGVYLKQDPYQLTHGDVVVLAGVVELRYHDPNATPLTRKLGRLSGLWVDPDTCDIWIDAEKLAPPLSKAQMHLLKIVIEANGQCVSKDEIASQIWPEQKANSISNDAVDSLVKRLRRRLSAIEHDNPVLEQIRGRGLRLKQER